MKKWAIISRHLVLPEARGQAENLPVYGIILIEDELIIDVVAISPNPEQIAAEYAVWNPLLFEDFYISPGLIDCNVCSNGEWENLEDLTLAAISGGVTFLLREDSVRGQTDIVGQCYCDVGTITRVDDFSKTSSAFAYKVYLYPPSSSIPGHAQDLDAVFDRLANTPQPLIVDASLPQDRWLHASSPYRLLSLNDRLEGLHIDTPASSGAYQKEIEDTESEEEDGDKEAKVNRFGKIRDDAELLRPLNVSTRFPRFTVIPEEASECIKRRSKSFKRNDGRKQSLPTIMTSLRKRINDLEKSNADLAKAEMREYEQAGATNYSSAQAEGPVRKRSSSFMVNVLSNRLTTLLAEESPDLSPMIVPVPVEKRPSFAERMKARRPLQLEIRKPEVLNTEQEYLEHLINSPDYWEVDGVRRVLKTLETHPRVVHFANVSAATAVNRILRKPRPDLTIETCPHHLFFSMEDVQTGDTRLKAVPPIRNKTNCNLLWELLKVNSISVISSQHTCIPPMLKFLDAGSFPRALPGVNGLGFSLQAVWTKLRMPSVHSIQMQEKYIIRLSKWMSLNPAKMLGISAYRGSIEKGKYADLLVWQPFEKSACGFVKHPQVCPYRGKELYGLVHAVYLRGKLAFQAGRVFAVGSQVSPN